MTLFVSSVDIIFTCVLKVSVFEDSITLLDLMRK